MATAAGTLETLALELGNALLPLKDVLRPDIFVSLGVELPPALAGSTAILDKITNAANKAADLEPDIDALADAIGAEDTTAIISAGAGLIGTIATLVTAFKELGDAVMAEANALSAADKEALQELAEKLAIRLLEYAGVGYLDEKLPSLTALLTLIGLIDKETDTPPELEVSSLPKEIIPRRFHIDLLPDLLSKPDQYLQDIFGWGTATFDGALILKKIQAFLQGLGLPAELYTVGGQPPVLEAYIFNMQVDTSVNPPGLKFEFNLPGNITDYDKTIPFSELWKGTVQVDASFVAGITGTLQPPFHLNIQPPSGNISLKTLLGVKAEKSSGEPFIIFGAAGGTRLQAKSIGGSIGVNVDAGTSGADINPSIQLEFKEGKLIIDFSQGDGFIQKILAGIHAEADFSLLADWDPENGLRLQGSGGVEVLIPLHIDLILVQLNGLYFSLGFSTEAPLQIGLAVQITASLGPLKAIVDHIGTDINFTFPSDGSGRLGLADIHFGFQPPKGVGLSLEAGPVTGGGFLSLDFEKGEYFGVLELSFQGIVDLKAIGIINTKMPDGSNGFALLILITAEFTPIQLGFGFTLNGVGGLLGLNHSTDIAALQSGVKTGAVNSILFPEDVVANVTKIISDLKNIFPVVEDHFVIAPMAEIGWGTPTLISLQLGIILDIPSPQLVILGVLKCVLPTEEAAILKLQVNFAGGINFEKGIWFNASLFDSRILIFTLTGDMALRIGWGDHAVFIISVGGFHPAFKEIPPDLKGMSRLSISLLSGDNPRITIQTYFAITSNTVQSGAKAELYAEACGFNVYGFLGYDLLVQFNPFYFIAEIYAGLALRSGTDVLAGISVYCQLSGPTPWHARGEASLEILFFEISVGFDVTWGEDAPAQPVETIDVLALIKEALNDDRNWKASLPPNTATYVTTKKIELPPDKIIIHPFTLLSVSQKVTPLEMEINKFGYKKPADDTLFHLTNEDATAHYVTEEFAIANYITLSDSEKLSRKSFEQMKSGLSFQTTHESTYGFKIEKEVNYELSYVIRKKNLILKAGLFKFLIHTFNVLVKGNAIYKSKLSVSKKIATNAPAKVEVKKPGYAVVNVSDMQVHTEGMVVESEAEAYYLQDSLISQNPSLKNKIQVVSQFELN